MIDQELNREPIDMINMNETDQTFIADYVIYRISNETINKVNHDININIVDKQIKCIVDSGADISVLHSDLVPTQYDEPRGRIRLESAFGHTINANVLNFLVRLIHNDADESCQPEVDTRITVTVTPLLDARVRCLLISRDVALLEESQELGGEDELKIQARQ